MMLWCFYSSFRVHRFTFEQRDQIYGCDRMIIRRFTQDGCYAVERDPLIAEKTAAGISIDAKMKVSFFIGTDIVGEGAFIGDGLTL